MKVTLELPDNAPGCFELVADDGRTLIIQVDYDFPGIAANFGFVPCDEGCGTDGTVACLHYSASDMISRAYDYLVKREGASFEDRDEYFEDLESDDYLVRASIEFKA